MENGKRTGKRRGVKGEEGTEEFLLQFQWKQNAPVGVVWGTKSDLC